MAEGFRRDSALGDTIIIDTVIVIGKVRACRGMKFNRPRRRGRRGHWTN